MNAASSINGSVAATRLRPGFYEPLADEPETVSMNPSISTQSAFAETKGIADGQTIAGPVKPEPRVMVQFLRPTDMKNAPLPEGLNLVGEYHILRGATFVIGGAPGVGKSRAAVALACAGATGKDWFGMKTHRQFRTMVLQSENGLVRLKNEFGDLDCAALDDWVCVSAPPPDGFAFIDREFCSQLRAAIADFKPDVFIVDTWSDCVQDSMEKDYKEGFARVRSCLPKGKDQPALGIVAHTRKPRLGERSSGRGLLNLLSGSQVIGRSPRAVFVVQSASDDTQDRRIVFTCCKNNDAPEGPRSAWELRNGLYAPVEIDWEAFDGESRAPKKGVTEAHIREVFEQGDARMFLKEAAEKLQEVASVGRTVAYNALKTEGGEFSRILHKREDRTLGLLGS